MNLKTPPKYLEDKPVDFEWIEDFAVRSINKKCYIEVICLTYLTIELYLQFKIRKFINTTTTLKDILTDNVKWNILSGQGSIDKLLVWAEVSFCLDLITPDLLGKIKSFNKKRNDTIHRLLKYAFQNKAIFYNEIKDIARLGREIQLILSPLNWNDNRIKEILYYFDNPEEAPSYKKHKKARKKFTK